MLLVSSDHIVLFDMGDVYLGLRLGLGKAIEVKGLARRLEQYGAVCNTTTKAKNCTRRNICVLPGLGEFPLVSCGSTVMLYFS